MTYTTTFNFVYSPLVVTKQYTVSVTFLDSCADPRFTKFIIDNDIEDFTYTIGSGKKKERFGFLTVYSV